MTKTRSLYFMGHEQDGEMFNAVSSDANELGAFIFQNHGTAAGTTVELGEFEAGSTLHFAYLVTNGSGGAPTGSLFRTDVEADTNYFAIGDTRSDEASLFTRLGIEDIRNPAHSDFDYNDLIVDVRTTAIPEIAMKTIITGAIASSVLITAPALAQCGGSDYAHKSNATVSTVANASQGKDIVDTAVAAGSFNTLAAALKAAGLVDALKGDGPFTVFAPTDDAFAKLPAGTVESLLKPENKDQLVSILTYHVVPANVMAKDVVKLNTATTLNGQRADIEVRNGNVFVDNAQVIKTDIAASNGTIHVIDSVILPESSNVVETAQSAGTFNTLIAAAKAAGLADFLMNEGPITVFAPTDEAFAKLPTGTVESLLKPENKGKLADILKYHVVNGRVYADQAVKAGSAATLLGKDVTISTKGGAKVNNANLVATDIEASNGVIHVVDSVLLPS
ncbi:unnamed protein product [Symbiodinium necroappetens]|uniref:FAS1 domain-containing protein n=1 Tax=Symbiodinium necroappetens TaxID=1628268 RepID=A0A812UTZ8_9DINO|nr:unnamed protein product [Symbiodinium necroappetens]